jgi:hypothetical protein
VFIVVVLLFRRGIWGTARQLGQRWAARGGDRSPEPPPPPDTAPPAAPKEARMNAVRHR